MLLKYRITNKYSILIFVIMLASLFISYIYGSEIYQYHPWIYNHYFTAEEKEELSNEDIEEMRIRGLSLLKYDFYASAESDVSIIMIVLACFSALLFSREKMGIFQYKYTRAQKYTKTVLSTMVSYAFITALYLYLAYVIFFIAGAPFFKMESDVHRGLLDLFFGRWFGNHFLVIYYVVSAFVNVFIFSFIICMFSYSVCLIYKKTYIATIVPMMYYFVANTLCSLPIFRPVYFFAPGFTSGIHSFAGINILHAFIPMTVPIITIISLTTYRMKRSEKIGI